MHLRLLFLKLLVLATASATLADETVRVPVHQVGLQNISEVLKFPGRVYAGESIKIIPRVEGNLLERPVTSGTLVEEGTTLFLIQPKPFEIALDTAQAALEQAMAKLDLAEKTLARAQTLTDRDVLPQQRMDEYQADYNVALTTVTTAERAVELATLRLGHTNIRAKYRGVLSNEEIALNDLVGPTRGAVGRLDIVDHMRVYIHVDEKLDSQYYQRQLAGEEINFDIRFQLSTGETYPEAGSVVAWDNEIDTRTGTRTIKLKFPNPDLVLTPGMSGIVLVREISDEGLLAIPVDLVQQDQLGRYVLIVGEDNVLKQQHLTLGAQVDDWWVVTDGLEGGEKIVAGALQRVRPGMTITPVAEEN